MYMRWSFQDCGPGYLHGFIENLLHFKEANSVDILGLLCVIIMWTRRPTATSQLMTLNSSSRDQSDRFNCLYVLVPQAATVPGVTSFAPTQEIISEIVR